MSKLSQWLNELTVIGVEIWEEDSVVHLLASLPKSYNTLVIALEASPEVPKMDVITEKLISEQSKRSHIKNFNRVLPTHHKYSQRKQETRCHFCHKIGHVQWKCIARAKSEKKWEASAGKNQNHKANQVRSKIKIESDSNSSTVGLVISSLLSVALQNILQMPGWLILNHKTRKCNLHDILYLYLSWSVIS